MYFGEIAALVGPGTGRSATVRAKTDCSVLSLDKPDFDRIIGTNKIREVLLENKHKYPKLMKRKIQNCIETTQNSYQIRQYFFLERNISFLGMRIS